MPILSTLKILGLSSFTAATAGAQDAQLALLNIGDAAPPLRMREWFKGGPILQFEKGKFYVVEFWASWCAPCKAAIPHLSELAHEYKDKISFIGVDVYEDKSPAVVKAFVDSMGNQMDYLVAAEDSNFMVVGWFEAFGIRGIPKSFVVDESGKVAWIGHPGELGKILPKIVNHNWNIKDELDKTMLIRYLNKLDEDAYYEFFRFTSNAKLNDRDKQNSILLYIEEVVRKEPRLKYAPHIASRTFHSLLITNPHKAYEYGKMVLVTPAFDAPEYYTIIGIVNLNAGKIKMPAEIYALGVEACQLEIDHTLYPEIADVFKLYNKMAFFYWQANNQPNAIGAQQKAIELLKNTQHHSTKVLAEYESRLHLYEKNNRQSN
jgi:thiol-disulfide isomerase/thioredoxin